MAMNFDQRQHDKWQTKVDRADEVRFQRRFREAQRVRIREEARREEQRRGWAAFIAWERSDERMQRFAVSTTAKNELRGTYSQVFVSRRHTRTYYWTNSGSTMSYDEMYDPNMVTIGRHVFVV